MQKQTMKVVLPGDRVSFLINGVDLVWDPVQLVVLPVVFETPFTRSPAPPWSCLPARVALAACPLSSSHPGGIFFPDPACSPQVSLNC